MVTLGHQAVVKSPAPLHSTLADRVASLESNIEQQFRTLQPKRYDPFSRRLTHEEELSLHQDWAQRLGITVTKSHVRYLQHRINEIETICAGRLAGDLRDAALRLIVASAVGGESLKALEIGTLFGVNAAILYDVASCLFDSVEMLIIDPLDGYYGRDVRDPATGLRISLKTVRRNFNLLRIPTGDASIIANRSDSESALLAARECSFNYMFIDGDHSYEGVRKDFELYDGRLLSGGFMVFDNYRDGTSPGVDQFVDEMREDARYELLGTMWRTAVYRKR